MNLSEIETLLLLYDIESSAIRNTKNCYEHLYYLLDDNL